jgi:phage terminase large subunit-like protein
MRLSDHVDGPNDHQTDGLTKTNSTSKQTTTMKQPLRISALSLGLLLQFSAIAGAVDQQRPLSQRATSFVIPPLPDIKVEKFRYSDGFNATDPGDDILQPPPLQEGLTDFNSSKHSSASNDAVVHSKETKKIFQWKGFDELDRRLLKIALPLTATFAINPLVQALDLFWVNRLGDALAVAGQAAANQVYGSSFWLFSFLPSVTATLVSKKYASGDMEGTQDAVCNALTVGFFISIIGSSLLFFNPEKALSSILKGKQNKSRAQMM